MKATDILYNGLRIKKEIIEEATSAIGNNLRILTKDEHARRPPRPCGMTIHPSYGCAYGCLYCYVKPLGRKGYILNKLSGLELITALSLNPFFLPGEWGTLVAFGSITECFIDNETTLKTIEYMSYVKKRLRNPQQISTKASVSSEAVKKIANEGDSNISFLVSISTFTSENILEPGAPSAFERLKTASRIKELGIPVAIFLRPIIPGITDRDFERLIETMKSLGLKELIMGSLLVNEYILKKMDLDKLREAHNKILERIRNLSRDKLRPIFIKDIKRALIEKAHKEGMTVYSAACSANIAAHSQGCWICGFGPCGQISKLPEVRDIRELTDILEIRVIDAWLTDNEKIIIRASRKIDKYRLILLATATRRKVEVIGS